jgi:hypothetical protein
MDADTSKTRETRLRRKAENRGLVLQKSRRRDPYAWDYGTYQLVDASTNLIVLADHAMGDGFGLSLDDIEAWLSPGREPGSLATFKVTARVTPDPRWQVTGGQAGMLSSAIANLASSRFLMPGTVQWNDALDQAVVTIACQNQDAAAAEEWARAFVRKQAEVMAHIHVLDVEIAEVVDH